jgi:hypothetical protein
MKKLVRPFALGLSMMVGFGVNIPALNAKTPSKPNQSVANPCEEAQNVCAAESVPLYYNRSADAIKTILEKIVGDGKTGKFAGTFIGENGTGTGEASGNNHNVIVLYGTDDNRKKLKRIIAILDLPRERVNMEMWGILISSDNPQQLAEVMNRVNKEIDKTQQLLQETYNQIKEYSINYALKAENNPDLKIEPDFKNLFTEVLGYKTAFDEDSSSLSMIDILLILLARNKPNIAYNNAANGLCQIFFKKDGQPKEDFQPFLEAFHKNQKKRPFENYIRLGLHQEDKGSTPGCNSLKNAEDLDQRNFIARKAVLNFALQYSRLKRIPAEIDPDALQESAETLNSVLEPVVNALNRDIEDLFIQPTLERIQRIVSEYDDVSYAEVGKTSVAGLNGIHSEVSSTSVSTFDETGPLRLSQWLEDAGKLNNSVSSLLPKEVAFEGSPIPVSSLISTVAALSADHSQWRGLTSGISITITPSVLRNSESAELQIDFTTGPKEITQGEESNNGQTKLRPLSRIAQSHVKTSVYVKTLDLFALSTFNNQTTEDGGRGYIPLIGPIWKGFFSGLPIVGDLFSWQNAPNNVQHQSIALVNSFIVPTAMGLAHLYSNSNSNTIPFEYKSSAVERYLDCLKKKNQATVVDSQCFVTSPQQPYQYQQLPPQYQQVPNTGVRP